MASYIAAAQDVLKSYGATQKILDGLIEFIPNEKQKRAYIFKRAAYRTDAKKIVQPLLDKLGTTSSSFDMIGLRSPQQEMIAKALYDKVTGLDICEKQLAQEIMIKYKFNNPLKIGMAGFFDFSSDPYEGKTDQEIGKQALSWFFDRASMYPSFKYSNVDDMTTLYSKDPNIIYEGLGSSIRMEAIDPSQLQATMEAFADKGQGQVPTSSTPFFQRLSDITANPSLLDAIKFTTVESVAQIAEGVSQAAQNVGTGVISTLKSASFLTKYLPWVLGAVGIGYLYVVSAPARAAIKKVSGK